MGIRLNQVWRMKTNLVHGRQERRREFGILEFWRLGDLETWSADRTLQIDFDLFCS